MIDIKIHNFFSKKTRIRKKPIFVLYKENIISLREKLEKYQHFKNIIIIGNGGSVNNFKAVYGSLVCGKNIEFLTTNDPDRINQLREKYKRKNTLVVAVSKSGETANVLEEIFAFRDYRKIFVTGLRGKMHEIAEKENIEQILYPQIGGRFSGFTASCFAPAILAGIDANKIEKGARKFFKSNDAALKTAHVFFELEKKGYTEIMCAIYSSRFSSFLPIIIQLMHESVCKNKKGQTIYGDEAPEIQHHTTQRFFGGRENVIGLFVTVGNYKSLLTEFSRTKKFALKNKKPFIEIKIDKISPETVGEFLAFWYYVAFYSALLRKVNPYDQPAVDENKNSLS